MSKFITENITEIPAVPLSPAEDMNFVTPSEIADTLVYASSRLADLSHRQAIDGLLQDAGVKISWTEHKIGESTTAFAAENMPENSREIFTAKLEERERQAQEIYDYANEHILELKKELVDELVAYGQSLGVKDVDLETMLASRIANIDNVKIDAPISHGKILGHGRPSAHFTAQTGYLGVNVDATIKDAETLNISKEAVIKRNTLHELLHGASFNAVPKDNKNHRSIKTGLGVMPEVVEGTGYRDWTGKELLDEGAQEHIRWKYLDGSAPGYEESVMFWEMMIALDPEIEKLRFEAKFLDRGRGEMIGHIESILGPSAVEEIEEMFKGDNTKLVNFPGWKSKMVEMIDIYDDDPDVREGKTVAARKKAREVLDQTQLEIFASRGWDYTDEQLIKAKENGAKNAVDIEAALT